MDGWTAVVASDPAWLAGLQQNDELPPEVVTLRTRRRDIESRVKNLLSAIGDGCRT